MRNYPNIEHQTQSGHARGYAAINKFRTAYDGTGRSWVVYGRSGYWTARASVTVQGLTNSLIGFENLAEISHELELIK